MAFKIKEGMIIDTTTVFDDSAVLQVAAPSWQNARTVTFATGDVTGSFSIDGTGDVSNVALTIAPNSVALGTDTTGNYVASLTAGTGINITGGTGEGAALTISTTQDLGTGSTPTFDTVVADVVGDVYANDQTSLILQNGTNGTDATFQGNLLATDGSTVVLTVGDGATTPQFEGNANSADVADALSSAVTIALTGDVAGSATFTSAGDTATITATIQADSVALGTDTTGNYVESVGVTAGTGLSVTGTGEGASVTLAGVDATTSTKGVASFSADNFAVAAGVVTIKDGGVANAELVNDSITIGADAVALGATITDINGLTSLDVDNITIDGNTISSTNTDGNIVLDPNGTGSIDASNAKIVNLATPTVNTDAATKEYVDTVASASLHYHDPVRVETEAELTATYDNGTSGVGATLTNSGTQAALVIDGITLIVGDRVLVYRQTNAAHNGIYEVTNTGSGSTNWVLTRTSDTDSYAPSDPAALGTGDAFYVKEGDTGAGELYVMTTEGTITFGTTGITFSQIASAQIYSAGAGLTLTGTEFSVNVDNSTIEISGGDALQVVDGGITNAKLANDHYTVATNGSGADFDIQLGDTWNFNQGTGITIALTGDTVTINNADGGSSQNIFKTLTVTDTDSGFTWSETGNIVAATNNDTVTFVSGTGIDIDVDTGNDAIKVINTDGGSSQDIIKSIVVDDTDTEYSWSESGTYTVSGNTDSLTFVSGDGAEIDIDTTLGAIKVDNTDKGSSQNIFKNIAVSGQTTIVADSNDDTLTVVAGSGISITTNATTDTLTISSTSGVITTDTNVTTTNATVVDSFSATTYRSAKVFIQITQGTNFQISELLVIHDGTTTYDTEYAIIETNGELATISTQLSGGNVEVLVTLNSAATAADVVSKKIVIDV